MATKKTDSSLGLFEPNSAGSGETRIWEYPKKLDWSTAKVGDLIQFSNIRHWDSTATEPVYLEAVGRLLAKGKTAGETQRYIQVEIIWDENIPRLHPDLRIFVLDQ